MSKFVNFANGMVRDIIPVTEDVEIDGFAVGLYITDGGDVNFVTPEGEERTITVPDNFNLICLVKEVKSAGTDASGIHAYVI